MNKILISVLFIASLSYANTCKTDTTITWLGFKLYDISYELNKTQKIKLKYRRDVEVEKNIEKSTEKFNENNSIVTSSQLKKLDLWHSKYVDMQENDTFTFEINEQQNTTTMYVKGQQKLVLNDSEFGKMYLNIWTGIDPVDDDFKEEVLKIQKQCTKG